MSKKICAIVRSSTLIEDTRFPKEIEILEETCEFIIIGWNRKVNGPNPKQIRSKFREIIFPFGVPYGKAIPYLPLWWSFVLLKLLQLNWDIIHVRNFDSAIPAIIAAKIKGKKIIYEILDTYEDQLQLPNKLRYIIICIDKIIMFLSDIIILADEEQISEFKGIPNRNLAIIYDSPPDFTGINSRLNIESEKFKIFYAGVLFKNRRLNIDKIISAVSEIEGVQLIIAGYGDLEQYIMEQESKMPEKVKFLGKISYNDALIYYLNADLIFALRDPIPLINKYICGSTLLNAMMCGKPILVNKNTSTAKKVQAEKCGLIVDGRNVEEIKKMIIMLRDNPEIAQQLGSNSRRAYCEKYGWSIMGKKLLDLYNYILN